MELVPARESRSWTLLMLGVAVLVGVPLMVWRGHADDQLGEAVQVFGMAAAIALLVVATWSVIRFRMTWRRARPAPPDAQVAPRKPVWRATFVVVGVAGGLAPFLRSGFEDSSAVFAAFAYGLCAGTALAVAYGLWYLRRAERRAGKELLTLTGGREYYLR